jgi:IclR family KDG regulon transcriptional repressor
MTTAPRRTIGSLQRAINILNLFNEQSVELGITEISEALNLHKSTVAGLVYTLEHNGYLEQDPTSRKYRLGLKLVERAFTALDQFDVRELALPHLEELRDWCDESVNLAIRDGRYVVYIERLLSTQPLGMRAKVGKRALVHSTALGKAILSGMSSAEVQQLVAQCGLPAITTNTITDPERFLEEINRTRERGFALDDEENEIGVRCVAAPIFDHTSQAVAAVSVSAPIQRIPMPEVPRYGARIKETAKAISGKLGYGFLGK